MSDALIAPHVLEYAFTRSLGPVLSAFFAGLREKKILGSRTSDGRVLVPPRESDETGTATGELVEVGPGGVVTTWSWVSVPRPKHPLDRPFAWALIKLDGADTAMLHAVDAGDEPKMSTGMRVVARWAFEPSGSIRDLAFFEPDD